MKEYDARPLRLHDHTERWGYGGNPVSMLAVEDPASRLVRVEPSFAPLVERVGPYRVHRTADAWEALACGVLYQQVSGRAAKRIADRIRAEMGQGGLLPRPEVIHQAPLGALKALGITSAKEAALRTLAHAIIHPEGEALDLGKLATMSDEEVERSLTRFKGVGPWTAHMYLVFHLGRDNVLMPGDLGLRKAIQKHYGLPAPPSRKEVEAIAARWGDVRTVATWYLWRSDPDFPQPGFG